MTGNGPDRTVGVLARLLLRRLREREAAPEAGLTVGELHRELLPYPRCREAAGLASKAEYDLAMLELLAEPALLSAEDPELVEAVEEERASMEPELGLLEAFSEVTLRPGPALEARAAWSGPGPEAAPAGPEPSAGGREREADRGGADAGSPDRPAGDRSAADRRGGDRPGDGEGRPGSGAASAAEADGAGRERRACGHCGHELPEREGARYCPWCGADQRSPRCGDCGEPLEAGWRYCPSCGREAGG